MKEMKVQTISELKRDVGFNEKHTIVEEGVVKAVSMKLLVAIWKSKGYKLYGNYNYIFEVLRKHGVVQYEQTSDKPNNIPTIDYSDCIIVKSFDYEDFVIKKMFFTKESSRVVKEIMKTERMLLEI